MGKNYVENSLKHFMKRKVKITLGFVVAFMISGTVGFAENITEHNKPFEEAIKNLAGLGINSLEFNNKTVDDIVISNIKDNSGNNTITIKSPNFEKEIKIQDKYLTENTKKIFENVISNLTTKVTTNKADENPINSLVLLNERVHGNILYNKGVIISRSGYSTQITNAGAKDTTLQNDGILISSTNGQYLYNTTNSKSFNNGIIISKSSGQIAGTINSEMVNNGLIITETSGQNGNGAENVNLLNKGVIAVNSTSSAASGQSSNNINIGKTEIKNYGLIDSNVFGQRLVTMVTDKPNTELSGKAENFGIIFAKTGQEAYGKNMSVYNYGLITTSSDAAISGSVGGTGFNYGVVKVDSANKAFSGDVTNKGIVIADSGTLADKYNTGILLDSNYNVIGDDVKVFNKGDIVQSFGEDKKDSFEGKDKGFVKNQSVEIDDVQSKVIGAVVTDNSKLTEGAVFNYTDEEKDLFLKDTSLVGYFEQDGTLLKVDGDLTLGASTNISAVKNDMGLDVTAVEITNGEITIADDAKINGIIKGQGNINLANTKGNYTLGDTGLINIVVNDNQNKNLNYVEIVLEAGKELAKEEDNNQTTTVNKTVEGVKLSTEKTGEGLINKVTIRDGLEIKADKIEVDGKKYSIYDENTANENTQLEMVVEDMADVKGDVLLGVGKDNFTTNAVAKDKYVGTIDLGAGEDKFVVNGVNTENEFAFNVANAESVELNGGKWNITGGSIGFSDVSRGAGKPVINLTGGAELNITLNQNGSNLSEVIENGFTEEGEKLSLKTEDGKIRYQIDVNTGLNFDKLNTDKYVIDNTDNVVAPVFNVTSDKNGTYVSLKTTEQLGLESYYSSIYEAYIKQLAGKNTTLITHINEMKSDSDLAKEIRELDVTAKAYYTAGTVVTKNITDAYLSAVEEFGERARKGEWIAQGKFINSDTEFDGGSVVKGYDGDMNSAVAMIEYGVSEDTSYGIAFGGGDTEINIDGGGKLDGDNYYVGLYTKFRTENGIDVVGNFGIMKSDLDSKLGNEFAFAIKDTDLNVSGGGYEEGTADSTAFALSLRGKKDINITDTVKIQPILGARMTLINQDKAENPGMNFEIKEQDVFVAEGIVGIHGAKEFALEQGIFEINTGIEYAFAGSTNNEDAEYTIFATDNIEIENGDIPSSKGTFHIGAEYEHENGVGVNGKYEMMWSDSGDDSRITAGVSYRF